MDHNSVSPGMADWESGAAAGMSQGMAVVPYTLLRHYRSLNLDSSECMLLVHLLGFQQVERKDFPSLEELQHVTGNSAEGIAMTLQKLIKLGLLGIDEHVDEVQGISYERYNLSGLYAKLGGCVATGISSESSAPGEIKQALAHSKSSKPAHSSTSVKEERNLFTIFEKEFGRPLSPMELETISGWVDADKYLDELILLALKEAVFAGKLHFRYIDRILLEWSRNRVRTAADAKAYTQKFRNMGR